jgi:hypothetical protein
LISILADHKGKSIWEFEAAAQETMQSLKYRSAVVFENTPKRGDSHFDSKIYPYIATAIVKGKWNTKEYKLELEELSREYEIDLNDRGCIN